MFFWQIKKVIFSFPFRFICCLRKEQKEEEEDRDMYALQKCKVLRDYENAPWQPLWLSSKEFMTAVGTMEDLHIFFFKQMNRVWSRVENGRASCRQLSGTTITWATISSWFSTIGWRLLNHIKPWVILVLDLDQIVALLRYQFLFLSTWQVTWEGKEGVSVADLKHDLSIILIYDKSRY